MLFFHNHVILSPLLTIERKSETVKAYLSQIVARFGIPKTLESDNDHEFASGDLNQ